MCRSCVPRVLVVCLAACGGGQRSDPPAEPADAAAPSGAEADAGSEAEAAPATLPDGARSVGPARGTACPGRSGAMPPRAVTGWFPLGAFDDANRVGAFEPAARDWLAHGLDSVMFMNGRLSRDAPQL